MKYLKVILAPIKMKGDVDDEETLRRDLYEKVQALIESGDLEFSVDEEDEDDED